MNSVNTAAKEMFIIVKNGLSPMATYLTGKIEKEKKTRFLKHKLSQELEVKLVRI